jgi:hypothetical protein
MTRAQALSWGPAKSDTRQTLVLDWLPRCSCQDWDVLLSPRLTFFSSL